MLWKSEWAGPIIWTSSLCRKYAWNRSSSSLVFIRDWICAGKLFNTTFLSIWQKPDQLSCNSAYSLQVRADVKEHHANGVQCILNLHCHKTAYAVFNKKFCECIWSHNVTGKLLEMIWNVMFLRRKFNNKK